MKIEAVFFDFDDTLIKASYAFKNALFVILNKIERDHKLKIDDEFKEMSLEIVRTFDKYRFYSRNLWWKIIGILLEINITNRRINEYTNFYWDKVIELSKLYDDAIPTLETLKNRGYKIGIISDTDGTPGIKRKRIHAISIEKYLDIIVIAGEDTKLTKPAPEPFIAAAEKLSLKPAQCVMVGDKPFTDIAGAKAAGMRAIYLKRFEWKLDAQPDAIIKNLSEVADAIGKIEQI